MQLIAISIDDNPDQTRDHLDADAWRSVRSVIDRPIETGGEDLAGFDSVTATDYTINGVPTAVLVDQQGEIVFRGHPSQLDLKQEVEKLLESRKR